MTSKNYKIIVSDREYKSWEFVDPETQTKKSLTESETLVNPIHYKLFNCDVVDLSTPIPTIVHSPLRVQSQIPGVLILEGNQTYGRTSNNNDCCINASQTTLDFRHFWCRLHQISGSPKRQKIDLLYSSSKIGYRNILTES